MHGGFVSDYTIHSYTDKPLPVKTTKRDFFERLAHREIIHKGENLGTGSYQTSFIQYKVPSFSCLFLYMCFP